MRLPVDRALLVLHLLTEGRSIRGIERITGTEKRTILRLLVQVGLAVEYNFGSRVDYAQLVKEFGQAGRGADLHLTRRAVELDPARSPCAG